MSTQLIKLIARFVDADAGTPLTDPTLRVKFFDLDLLKDDFLGESVLSSNGVAQVICSSSDFASGLLGKLFDRLKEKKPDIYCEVIDQNGIAVYRSAVQWNIDPMHIDKVTHEAESTIDLGEYKFRRGDGLLDMGMNDGIRQPLM